MLDRLLALTLALVIPPEAVATHPRHRGLIGHRSWPADQKSASRSGQ